MFLVSTVAFSVHFSRKWPRQMSTSNLSLSVSDRLKWWLTFVSRVRSCIFCTFLRKLAEANVNHRLQIDPPWFFAPAAAADGISVHFPMKMAEANVNQQPEPVCIRQAQVVVDICFSCPQLHFRCIFQGNWPGQMSTSSIRSKN